MRIATMHLSGQGLIFRRKDAREHDLHPLDAVRRLLRLPEEREATCRRAQFSGCSFLTKEAGWTA